MAIQSNAPSSIFDTLTLSDAPSSGFLRFDFDVDGTVVSSVALDLDAGGNLTPGVIVLIKTQTNKE